MDALLMARMQFAANISFHILFPTITIALAWVLLFFKLRHRATGKRQWLDAYKLWVKVYALSFALGVVSGVTMSFQFGTNWPGYMNTVGNIAGPLLAYEVMTAFFMEATFLSVMLFGMGRVSDRTHTLATLVVAIGTTISAFWILALNSWMHTPDGFVMINGQAHATDWLKVIFNPSFPYRLLHMLCASGLTVAFLIAGLSAYRWLRNDRAADVLVSLRTGVYLGALLIPVQIVLGDFHGLNTLEHQPAKIAAIEAVWETERGASLLMFNWPDEQARSNRYAVGIPKMASFILTHNWDGEIQGLNSFAEHPPVKPLFFAFRIMVGTGIAMLLVSWFGAWRLWRHGQPTVPLARALLAMSFAGWIATLAGWYVTEIGRQPWLVTGVLKTSEAAATNVPTGALASTLTVYLLLYASLLVAFVGSLFFLARHALAPIPELANPANNGDKL